jgi:hypothetical protein
MPPLIKNYAPKERNPRDASLPKPGVPDGQHAIPQPQHILHNAPVWVLKQVRFTTLGVDMRMGTEEGRENPNLVPSHEHLRPRISKEPTNVSYNPSRRTLQQGLTFGHSHPAKVIPAIPFASTILIPTAMWSQVPMLSPVHMAA